MIFVEIDKNGMSTLPFAIHSMRDSGPQVRESRPTGFECHQLLWCTEGEGRFSVGGEEIELLPGTGVYTAPFQPHCYYGVGLHTGFIAFTMSEQIRSLMAPMDWLCFEVTPTFERESRQLLAYAAGESTLLGRSAAGYAFAVDFFSAVMRKTEERSAAIRRLLERRYAEPLTLPVISAEVDMDKYTACHIYKKERGVTIMDDLNAIRVQKAKQLLKYDNASAEQIGRLCGFESPSYFGKRFKEIAGCTPGEYRKRFK